MAGSGRGSEEADAGPIARGDDSCEALTRRALLARGTLAAAALAAIPAARAVVATPPAYAADVLLVDGTLQACFDTIVPGRKVAATESGAPVHPLAIAGADSRPGAVEADALVLSGRGIAAFDLLRVPFLAELEARALTKGGAFLLLDYDRRAAVFRQGLDLSNPTRPLWELTAVLALWAFTAAMNVPSATAATSVGYATIGMPGEAPSGYADASYRKRLARERASRTGNLP